MNFIFVLKTIFYLFVKVRLHDATKLMRRATKSHRVNAPLSSFVKYCFHHSKIRLIF